MHQDVLAHKQVIVVKDINSFSLYVTRRGLGWLKPEGWFVFK